MLPCTQLCSIEAADSQKLHALHAELWGSLEWIQCYKAGEGNGDLAATESGCRPRLKGDSGGCRNHRGSGCLLAPGHIHNAAKAGAAMGRLGCAGRPGGGISPKGAVKHHAAQPCVGLHIQPTSGSAGILECAWQAAESMLQKPVTRQ